MISQIKSSISQINTGINWGIHIKFIRIKGIRIWATPINSPQIEAESISVVVVVIMSKDFRGMK